MFVNKYRPKTFKQLVGRDDLVLSFKKMIASKDGVPHMLFIGPSGVGKTTCANIIANEIFGENKSRMFFQYNASSKERGIDFVRDTVVELAKRRAVYGDYNLILMDEADCMTFDAQAAFRGLLEKYPQTRFIFTANYPNKIIKPIRSRFAPFIFEKLELKVIAGYLKRIIKHEDIVMSDKSLIAIAKKADGDLRLALNLVEGNMKVVDSVGISKLSLKQISTLQLNERIELVFKDDPEVIFGEIWTKVQAEKRWDLLPILADCQAKMNISIHKTIFLANLMEKI